MNREELRLLFFVACGSGISRRDTMEQFFDQWSLEWQRAVLRGAMMSMVVNGLYTPVSEAHEAKSNPMAHALALDGKPLNLSKRWGTRGGLG